MRAKAYKSIYTKGGMVHCAEPPASMSYMSCSRCASTRVTASGCVAPRFRPSLPQGNEDSPLAIRSAPGFIDRPGRARKNTRRLRMRLECFMPGAGCKIQSSARRSAWPSGPHHPFVKRGSRAPAACTARPPGLRVFGSGRTPGRWRRPARAATSPLCGSGRPTQRTSRRALRAPAACAARPAGLRLSGSGRTQAPGRLRRPARTASPPYGSGSPMQRTPRRAVARQPTRQFHTVGILRLPARNARASRLPKSTAGTAAPNLCRGRCASFGLDLTLSQRKPGP
ncbi:hypothetical protein SAMN05444389_10669 [Paracoccus solventivorans]|uniref:Uncharacterized protein n=1 Tax=Paracoccus solventivorans TaxID=53463 RepID=A0A1M7HFU4_9RHOB|nr:hypothetical protein SAMN05444389_10669 [Paracoccus solventivorans]